MHILIAKENKFVACIIVVYQLTFFSVFLFPFDYFSTFFNFFLRLTLLLTTASLWWNRNNYYNLTLSLSMIANNTPYGLLCNLYDVSSENLVLDQLIIHKWLIFYFIVITCWLDIVPSDIERRTFVLVTHQGLFKGSTHLFVIPATCKGNVVICSEFLV